MNRQHKSSVNTSADQSSVSINTTSEKSVILSLQLSANPKLLASFGNDPHSDVCIIHGKKQFRLNKAHLRLETDFFECPANEFIVKQEFHQQTFEEVLKCIYGSTFNITRQQDVYHAFNICTTLRLESLVKAIRNAILEDFSRFNFFMVLQLGEVFQDEKIRAACQDYLENYAEFRSLLDIGQAKFEMIKARQLTSVQLDSLPPTSLFMLNEPTFKNLIMLHNSYKLANERDQESFLTYQQIYDIIRLYVECRVPDDDDTFCDYLRIYVVDLIDKRNLTASEYKSIYHSSELLLKNQYDYSLFESKVMEEPTIQTLNSTVTNKFKKKEQKLNDRSIYIEPDPNFSPSNTSLSMLTLQKKNHLLQTFEPLRSENFLTKLELREVKDENTMLLREIQKLKTSLEQSVQNGNNFFSEQIGIKFNQLDDRLQMRIGQLQQDLTEVKTELQQKKQEILQRDETIRYLKQQMSEVVPKSSVIDSINDRDYDPDNQIGMESQFVDQSQASIYRSCVEPIQNNSIFSTQSQFMQGEEDNISIALNQTEEVSVYQLIQQNRTMTQNLSALSILQNKPQRLQYDYEPTTIEDHNQTQFLADYISDSIFNQIILTKIYQGQILDINLSCRDGHTSQDFKRACFGYDKILVFIKSWDYGKDFGVFLPFSITQDQDEYEGKGWLFSVTHSFAVPFEKVMIDDEFILKIRNDLAIKNDCTSGGSFCFYPESLPKVKKYDFNHLTGASTFQVDDIEAYAVSYSQNME